MAITGIQTPHVERYLEALLPSPDPVLREMEAYAAEHDFPIVGPQVGRLLELLARTVRARTVVELGSGFGYSAAWFLRGMEGGILHLTDFSKEHARMAEENLTRMGFSKSSVARPRAGPGRPGFRFHTGDALALLPRLPVEEADILFMDIDKEGYPAAGRLFAGRLKRGAVVVVDNLLWSGAVATEDDSPPTRAIREFTRSMLDDPRFLSTVVPVRDGVGLFLKVRP